MGRTQAAGMAEGITKGWIDLTTALHWHLRSNLYPPLPRALIETAKTAIERANTGDFDSMIDLPRGIAFRAETTMSVNDVVESLHLEPYITYEE